MLIIIWAISSRIKALGTEWKVQSPESGLLAAFIVGVGDFSFVRPKPCRMSDFRRTCGGQTQKVHLGASLTRGRG